MIVSAARIVTPSAVVQDGWISVQDGRIAEVGQGCPPGPVDLDLAGRTVVPGFVDLHMHGGGGFDATASDTALAAAVAFHLRHGTTRTQVSLMTAALDDLCAQLGWVNGAVQRRDRSQGTVVGAHLEGPFLAGARCGAQSAEHLQAPDPQVLDKLLEAAQGTVTTVTVAPELPGALDLIAQIVDAGAVAAIGHTDASYEQARAGFDAGATLATHLFNAIAPLNHRAPGPAPAAFDSGAWCEVINDGVHLHPAIPRLVARVDDRRLVLVTDAISATGVGDGDYRLGGQPVSVRDGQPRLPDGQLAGSTLTMDVAFRRAVQVVGLTLVQAAAAASTNPAAVLGLSDRAGAIAPGLDADLVVLDDDLRVVDVLVAGTVV